MLSSFLINHTQHRVEQPFEVLNTKHSQMCCVQREWQRTFGINCSLHVMNHPSVYTHWHYSWSLIKTVFSADNAMLSSLSNWQMVNSAKHCHPWHQNCRAGSPMAHPYCGSPPTSARGESPKCQMGAGDEYPSLHLWKMSSHQHDAPKNTPTWKLFRALSLTVLHLTTVCRISRFLLRDVDTLQDLVDLYIFVLCCEGQQL